MYGVCVWDVCVDVCGGCVYGVCGMGYVCGMCVWMCVWDVCVGCVCVGCVHGEEVTTIGLCSCVRLRCDIKTMLTVIRAPFPSTATHSDTMTGRCDNMAKFVQVLSQVLDECSPAVYLVSTRPVLEALPSET